VNYTHQNLADGKWFKLSLAEQLGNIGSEVDRIISWKKKGNIIYAEKAFFRAVELLALTTSDKRWYGPRLKELCRLKEVLCDSFLGGELYNTPLEYFSKYFYQFALVARKGL